MKDVEDIALEDVYGARGEETKETENPLSKSRAAKKKTPELPEGWTRLVDESGSTYYANAATGETSWEPPPALPAGWSAHVDEGSGSTYYVNAAGETTWDRPPADGAVEGEQQPPGSGAWTKHVDEASGSPYYVHADGTCQWDPPEGFVD